MPKINSRANLFFLAIIFLGFFGFFGATKSSEAAIIFSDNFDSQPDWNMSQSASLLSGWSDKMEENRGGSYEVGYISSTGAHGGSGKGFVQYWDQAGGYGYAQDSWLMKSNLNFTDDWYLGYWFQHDPNWDWGSVASLKLLKVHFDNGETWDIFWTNFCSGCPSWNVPAGTGFSMCTDDWGRNWGGSWNVLGSDWHYFVWHFKHSTGTLELSIDGADAMKTAYTTSYPGTGWDSAYGFSFGGNITNGGGGVNEMWTKYDDVVLATSKVEVENFLGINSVDITAPSAPTGLSVN
jgi:hypothetical protein